MAGDGVVVDGGDGVVMAGDGVVVAGDGVAVDADKGNLSQSVTTSTATPPSPTHLPQPPLKSTSLLTNVPVQSAAPSYNRMVPSIANSATFPFSETRG